MTLILRSSVAFLAIPGLVDVAQFFIIASIGLALGSVVMGFNIQVDEKLSELEQIIIERPEYVNSRNKFLLLKSTHLFQQGQR
jgi:hypothetical protein